MNLPVPINQVLQSNFTAYNTPIPVQLLVPPETDLHNPLIVALNANIQKHQLFIFTINLVSQNGYNNQRYAELFGYYCEVVNGNLKAGINVQLTSVAMECVLRYAYDQGLRYNLAAYLPPGDLNEIAHTAQGLAAKHDQLTNVNVAPAHNGFLQPQPYQQQQGGLTMSNSTQGFATLNDALVPANSSRSKRNGNPLLKSRKANMGTQVNTTTAVIEPQHTAAPANTARKARSLHRGSPSKVASTVHVEQAPAEVLAPAESLSELAARMSTTQHQPKASLLTKAPTVDNGDWDTEGAGIEVDTGGHVQEIASFDDDVVDNLQSSQVVLTEVFPAETKFLVSHFDGELPDGTLLVDGFYLYTEDAMKSKEPRRFCTAIGGFIGMARLDVAKNKLVSVYINKELLVQYEDHELELKLPAIKATDVLPYSEAKKLEVVECELRTHVVEGAGENSIDYDRSVVAAIYDSMDAPEEHYIRKAVIQRTSNIKSVAITSEHWNASPLNMAQLLHGFNGADSNSVEIPDSNTFSGRMLSVSILESERLTRTLIDNFLMCTNVVESWDDYVQDFGAIRALLTEYLNVDEEVVIDDILNNIAVRSTSLYSLSDDNPVEGFTLDDEDISDSFKESRILYTLSSHITARLDMDAEDCGIDVEDSAVKSMSSHSNKLLHELTETMFGTGYAFCDSEAVVAHVDLSDGTCLAVYRALPGRLPTYRVV